MPKSELVQALQNADAYIAGAWAVASFGPITCELETLLDAAERSIQEARAALAKSKRSPPCA